MTLFDKKHLPDVAGVEQVRIICACKSYAVSANRSSLTVLCDRCHAGREDAKNACRRDGTVAG